MAQYCYKINNPKQVGYDLTKMKDFVGNLYTGDDPVPITSIYYSKINDSICVQMKGRAKKNLEKIETIHTELSKKKLIKFNKDISLSPPVIFEVKAEEWWTTGQQTVSKKGGKRWNTLVQRGPYFTHLMIPYQPLGASLIYDGVKYPLTPEEEKVAVFYARRLLSEAGGNIVELLTEDPVFNKNYWTDFKEYLTPEHKKIFKDFDKLDWSDVITKVDDLKSTELTTEEKTHKKTKIEEKKAEYAYAILDGNVEKVGNFTVEPAAIFYGRGKKNIRGRIKKEIFPEDVIINIGPTDPVPEPPTGHKWGGIVHDQNKVWLARYTDTVEGNTKYVMFSAEGKFKGQNDMYKYEKARKLDLHIKTIREQYMKDAKSTNLIKKQLGTVLYLIDHFGIRVGGEKEDEGDDEKGDENVVGASTLKVSNLKLSPPNTVIFDFYGKDSIHFYKELEMDPVIYNNVDELITDKNGENKVFDQISSRSINLYLKEFDKAFSAKVFRTRLASTIMYTGLQNVEIPEGSTKAQTKALVNQANKEVAEVLNHTRNISQKAKDAVGKDQTKLKELKKELKEIKKSGKSTAAIEKRIQKKQDAIDAKTNVMAVAINTSLVNYIDPRLVVSYIKGQNTDISAIYTSTLIKKFKWAIETTESDWDYKKSPLVINPDLEPIEEKDGRNALDVSFTDSIEKKKKSRKSTGGDTKITKKKPKKVKQGKVEYKPAIMGNSSKVYGPGTKEDYNHVNMFCSNPSKNFKHLAEVPDNVLDWLYKFAKYSVDKGTSTQAGQMLVKYYEATNKK